MKPQLRIRKRFWLAIVIAAIALPMVVRRHVAESVNIDLPAEAAERVSEDNAPASGVDTNSSLDKRAIQHPAAIVETPQHTSPWSDLPPADTRVIDIYDDLKARADAGDGRAACRLAFELQSCRHAATLASIYLRASESRSDAAANRQTTADSDQKKSSNLALNAIEQRNLEREQHKIERCTAFPAEKTVDTFHYWRRAARLGHLASMYVYADAGGFQMDNPFERLDEMAIYKGDAHAVMQRAAEHGDWRAVQALAIAYEPIKSSYLSMVTPSDEVQSVAYHLLSKLAIEESATAAATSNEDNFIRAQDFFRNRISAEKLAEAISLARQRYASWFQSTPQNRELITRQHMEVAEMHRGENADACNEDTFVSTDGLPNDTPF